MIGDVDRQVEPNHRFFHLVKYLSSRFDEVDFISYTNPYGGPPTSLSRKIRMSLRNLIADRRQVWQDGNVQHIVVRRLKMPQFAQNLVGDLWAFANLVGLLTKQSYDVCVYSHPHNAFLIRLLKRYEFVDDVIYDDCDFFPDGPDAAGALSALALSWKEHLAITQADGVTSVSRSLVELREDQGARRVMLVPNGVDLNSFLKARKRVSHSPTLIYVGLLAEGWNLELVLKALPLIAEEIPDIRLVIVGSGNNLEQLTALTASMGLSNRVEFAGQQPNDELWKYFQRADVGVAIFQPRKFNEYASHLKIREYMAAGLPVISSKIGEAPEIISASQAGTLVENSPQSIASAAISILSNQVRYEEYSANAKLYADGLDWEIVLKPFLDLTTHAL